MLVFLQTIKRCNRYKLAFNNGTIYTMKTAQEYLIAKGVHPSHQRVAIMDYLLKNRTHPTVETLYEALHPTMPTLSKTTIYNTLKLLEEKGALVSINIEEKHTRYDADTHPHAHFQCVCCHTIYDIILDKAPDLPQELESGDTATEVQLYYKGICHKCKQNQ